MLDSLLQALSMRPSSGDVFNQYRNTHVLNNLKLFLNYLLERRADVLFIGEAPGYRGCRLTGIPFTSASVIQAARHDIFKEIGHKIKLEKFDKEPTASIFWEYFDADRPIPIVWNAFPFHPHLPGKPDSNRKPNRMEIEEGKHFLLMMHNIFKPKRLCSLGKVGQAALKDLFPVNEIIYIRHPSRGAKKLFRSGMAQLC